ncbi:MAG: tyrosine-type recombinase/integrase [Terriglobales bacterium]|jgi:integrase
MRSRHQDGWIEERGTRQRIWYGHYYTYLTDANGQEKRRHVGVRLGEKSKMRKWEAENKLRGIIATHAKHQPGADHQTLAWFARERFLPMHSPQWAPATKELNTGNIDHHIVPALGDLLLTEIDKFRCQVFLNDLAARGFSFSLVDHNRTLLKSILEEAIDAELIGRNPARKLKMPETKMPVKFVLPKDQARTLLDSLCFRDRLIAMIAAFCAMRPGEIFGLTWSSWRGDHFQIESTAWRGQFRPGKAKTKGSKAPVIIPDVVLPLLTAWREQNKNAPEDALIFPSKAGKVGHCIRPENWLHRRVHPIAKTLGIAAVNFQILRRTFATNAQGGNLKDVQTHLRHSTVGTTANVYVQAIPESVRKLVNSVADDVMSAKPITEQIQ